MALSVRGELEGVAAAVATLEGLKKSLRGRITRRAVTKAARQLARGAKASVPKGPTGLLKKSIGSKVKTYRSGTVVGIIGARKGYRQVIDGVPRDPAKYAHLSEGGRRAVAAVKARALRLVVGGTPIFRRSARAVTGKRWLRRAWAAGKKQAEQVVAASIAEDIAKQAAKG